MTGWIRKVGWKTWVGLFIGTLLLGGWVFVVAELLTAVHLAGVSPAQGAVTASGTVPVVVSAPRLAAGSPGVALILDGEPVPADEVRILPGRIETTARLADGEHRVEIQFRSRNVFARERLATSTFVVDTTAPFAKVVEPAKAGQLSQTPTAVRVTLSEPATALLLVDGRSIPLSVDGLQAQGKVELKEGDHRLGLRVTDVAGNVTAREWNATADFSKPTVKLDAWPGNSWKEVSAELNFTARDNLPRGLRVKATVDDRPVEVAPAAKVAKVVNLTSAGTAGAKPAASAKKASADGDRPYVVKTGKLPEGRHELLITVSDAGGHAATVRKSFVVDSTSVFGLRELGPGALGRDVSDLQRVLKRKGVYQGDPTSVFDERTEAAVVAFKEARKISPATSELDAKTMSALVGAIRIDRNATTLSLLDGGKVVKTYRVAVGQARYPTPRGSFTIISKEYNPTWNPPPSPWAEGLEPVPPGPGNPLGTRWMGLSTPAVGIHGTYASSSIGSWASHGCIRMHIRDVEELFELVYVGTSVTIY